MTMKKRWGLFGGVTVLLFMLLYLFLIWPVQKKFNLSHHEAAKKTAAFRNFLTRSEGPPTETKIGLVENQIKILEEKYADIENALIHEVEEKSPITPVKFGKILYETKKDLLRDAERAGLGIPPDLGFKETIPAEEEVQDMVKELEAVTFIIKQGIAFRFGDITEIKYPGIEVKKPWEKVGIELQVNGKFEDIAGFLYSLSQREKIYIIKSLEITKAIEKIIPPRVSKLKARAASVMRQPKLFIETEEEDSVKEKSENKIKENLISAIVRVECYNYIVTDEN